MKAFLTTLAVCIFFVSSAQDSSTAKFNVKSGISYQSALHYYGRTDSLQSSGVFPQLELWLEEKLYFSVTPVLISNSMSSMQYAGSVATAGIINNAEKSFSHFYLMKPFYKDQSLVQSALKAQAGISHSLLSKVLNVTLGIDGKLSDKFDIGASAGVDHLWRHQFKDQSILVINPAAMLNMGTQQFTSTYYKQSQFTFFPGIQETKTVKQFAMLSYELSVPLIYRRGKLMFNVTPAYVVPKNLIKVENDPGVSERGKKMFYFTVSAKITL